MYLEYMIMRMNFVDVRMIYTINMWRSKNIIWQHNIIMLSIHTEK